jgi:hypothetical protein
MNRRELFKQLIGSTALLAIPELLLPCKTIFLPPRGGWIASDFKMREIKQYYVNDDVMLLRYDVAWVDGMDYQQFHVDFNIEASRNDDPIEIWEENRAAARAIFSDIQEKNGFRKTIPLSLPRGVDIVRFV